MKKKLVVLGIAFIFIVSGFLSGVFAPFIRDSIKLSAAVGDHKIETATSMAISNLPDKEYKVADNVPNDAANNGVASKPKVEHGHFTLSRYLGRDILVAVSDASYPDYAAEGAVLYEDLAKFDKAGTYIYRFYTPSQYISTDTANGAFNGKSFHEYVITVTESVYTISLPTNDKDIFPNVTVPNKRESNPRNKSIYDPTVAPIVPLVLPLPQSVVDTKGRDMLALDGEEAVRNEAIAALKEVYGDAAIDAILNDTDKTDADLRDLVYASMRIAFYGNGNTEYSRDTEEGYTALQLGIKDEKWRTFIPTNDGGTYYAEYYFEHIDNARGVNISASLRTQKITVEQPNATDTLVKNIKTEILFDAKPSMSFTPNETSFKVGTEMTLPVASMTISIDSEIQFDSETSVTTYSYIVASFHDKQSSTFRYVGKNGEILPQGTAESSDKILRITNFKFTPKEVGTYRFTYYTTTIFGYGKNNHSPKPETYGGKYIKHWPFDDLEITSTQAPEIKWTDSYEYKIENGVLQGAFFGTDTSPTKLADAVDYSKYLPGTTTSSKTKIQKGEYLYIPALLGESNYTKSNVLDYRLTLYRYENGVKDTGNPILWYSGKLGENTTYGNVWNHTKPFKAPNAANEGIYFPNKSGFESTDFLGSANNGKAWQGKDVAGKYELSVRALDNNGNSSSSLTYTFEVVDGLNASRPNFNGLLKIGKQEYYENETVKFNVANPTDTYTDDVKIDVKYYVSQDGSDIGADVNPAVEIKNDSRYKGMSVKNGVVSFELNKDNPAGQYVLNKLATSGDSFQFRIYAVARNYHSLVRDINIGDWISTTGTNVGEKVEANAPGSRELTITEACRLSTEKNPDPLPYVAAAYDTVNIYKMTFGEAAKITTQSAAGLTWGEFLDAQKPAQGKNIAIPGLTFEYDSQSYNSTITYEIVHKDTNTSISATSFDKDDNVIGGGWQGSIGSGAASVTLGDDGSATGKASQRYFQSSVGRVGLHWVIVKVTNSGGNVGIFVGSVLVTGVPTHNARLVYDGVNTMRIGQSKSMPSVEVTIGGEKFESGGDFNTMGQIVSASSKEKVGTYTISFGSENGSKTNMDRNVFVPTVQGTYVFRYNVTIDNDTYLPVLAGGNVLSFPLEFKITVGNLESDDIDLKLDTSTYNNIANGKTALYGTGGEFALEDTDANYDPTKTNRYNFFTEMAVGGAEGETLEMTDSQLYKGAEPSKGKDDAFDSDMTWQYGRIYLPNARAILKSEVSGLGAEFYDNADSYVTVSHSKSQTGTLLLDTRSGSPTANQITKKSVAQEGMYWFRPVGQLKAQYIKDGEEFTPTNYSDALRYAAKKDAWEPANKEVTVDGEYIVTYTVSYMGTTVTKKYSIAMGDTRKPKITYKGSTSSDKDVFERTYKVGDTMKFVFSQDTFNISGTKNNEFFWAKNDTTGKPYLYETKTNPNIFIRISRDSGVELKEGDDDYAIQVDPTSFAETHSFRFTEAGTYTITFDIKGVSTWGQKVYKIKVSEKTAKTQIAPEEVIGTILLILSIGLLLGVVIYFFKTGRSTRFSSKRGVKKAKEEKPDVV